eukprot:1158927-Pelagomonas_calceolata.AAC.2
MAGARRACSFVSTCIQAIKQGTLSIANPSSAVVPPQSPGKEQTTAAQPSHAHEGSIASKRVGPTPPHFLNSLEKGSIA